MPSIRIPSTVEPLLPFCRKSDDAVEHACFDTYADLVVFSASYGFQQLSGAKPPAAKQFLEVPNPIDIAIFKNQQSFPQLLLIALATERTETIAKDEERLCRLIEALADEGGKALSHELKQATPASFYLELANLLEEAAEGKKTATI